jgi:vitamin B12 transporter
MQLAGTLAAVRKGHDMLNKASAAGLLGVVGLAAQAQVPPNLPVSRTLDPVVVTATRALSPQTTLRDATVITREELDAAGPLSLGELLERYAGVELRATGGPGQPQGLFIRGAGTAQTLVLVDGMRVGSATIGSTAIEHIPLELIERIEIVKGPLSSLWGSEAMGGVVQIFTRGKSVPHLFTNLNLGTDRDRRVAAGITTIEKGTAAVLTMGYREVDAPSATTDRVPFCHDPDRDPYDNAYANLRVAHRLWQGENIVFETFGSRGRTRFDGCGTDDRNEQVIAGARLTSSAAFARDWLSRLAIAEGLDRLEIFGGFPDRFETRQDQVSWINEVTLPLGTLVGGLETVRQRVESAATPFAQNERKTDSLFVAVTETWREQRLEASWRRDDDDAFGKRDTGSVGAGIDLGGYRLAATYGRGFRAPTFYDLYGPTSDFYQPNPNLKPERNVSTEVSLKSPANARVAWRVTAYDNQIEDLIAYVFPTVVNVNQARIRGVEANAETTQWNIRWRGALTLQRPENDVTGARLQGRAESFGSLTASRTWGNWTAWATLHASGDRYDSPNEDPASRLGGYATVDARLVYKWPRQWAVELAAVNLTDKRYETSVGYEGTRRGVMLSVRFEAF